MMVATNLGIVVGYTINSYLDYYTVPFIVLSILAIFLIGFPFAADSPKHLMTQNRSEDAIAALKYFRGYTKSDQHFSKEFEDEIKMLKNHGQLDSKGKVDKLTIKDFCKNLNGLIETRNIYFYFYFYFRLKICAYLNPNWHSSYVP
jgi:uncharacterized membrane protein